MGLDSGFVGHFKRRPEVKGVIKTEFYDKNGGLTDDHVELAIELLNSEIPN